MLSSQLREELQSIIEYTGKPWTKAELRIDPRNPNYSTFRIHCKKKMRVEFKESSCTKDWIDWLKRKKASFCPKYKNPQQCFSYYDNKIKAAQQAYTLEKKQEKKTEAHKKKPMTKPEKQMDREMFPEFYR